jgi:hypothetical protein
MLAAQDRQPQAALQASRLSTRFPDDRRNDLAGRGDGIDAVSGARGQ